MLTTCPACGARASLDVLIADEAARNALAVALIGQGEIGLLLVRYLALFRPARRALAWDRVRALLEEIQPAITAGRIERRGRSWSVPREAWIAALGTVLAASDRLQLPLKSHGYLYEILIGAADQAEARAEAARETGRHHAGPPPAVGSVWAEAARETGRHHAAQARGPAAQAPMPETVREQLRAFRRHRSQEADDDPPLGREE